LSPSLCIITPSYSGDIEQFALLRRSLRLFAPDIPHIAIVHTEDYFEFQDRFARESNLEVFRTRELLPSSVEARRRKSGPRWLTGKWLHGRRISGWVAQQITKLHALAQCDYDAVAFIDSDVFLCRPIQPDYFFIDGRLKLFRRPARDAESLNFDIATHIVLGNALHQVHQLYDYIYSPACFRKSTAVRLFEEFKRRKRSTWARRFASVRSPSEYNLLGYTATVLEHQAGYHLLECEPEDLHHSIRFPEDRDRLEAEISSMRTHRKDFVRIQSRLDIHPDRIASAFDKVVELHKTLERTTPEHSYAVMT
jgi:hypothetical protein